MAGRASASAGRQAGRLTWQVGGSAGRASAEDRSSGRQGVDVAGRWVG